MINNNTVLGCFAMGNPDLFYRCDFKEKMSKACVQETLETKRPGTEGCYKASHEGGKKKREK